MRLLVRAPGQTFQHVMSAVCACDGTTLFTNRKKSMLVVEVPEGSVIAIRQVGGEIWIDDRDAPTK